VDVILSPQTESDILEIGDFIAKDNPDRARSFCREVIAACASLSTLGRRIAIIPKYRRFGLRKFGHGRYLSFFYIENDVVYVVRVFHGARDFDPLLGESLRIRTS
jgi:toxin ParE1/3/4